MVVVVVVLMVKDHMQQAHIMQELSPFCVTRITFSNNFYK